MGCFSYICKECGTSIRADGERCIIFLLKKGMIQQIQHGKYDNYGSCDEFQKTDFSHSGESWKIGWDIACQLQFSPDSTNGFAVYHEACWKGEIPKTRSIDDPEQGREKARQKFCKKVDLVPYMNDEIKNMLCIAAI